MPATAQPGPADEPLGGRRYAKRQPDPVILPPALARLQGNCVAIDVSTTLPAELWPRIWVALQASAQPVAWVRYQVS